MWMKDYQKRVKYFEYLDMKWFYKNIFIAEFSVILHEYIIANTIYVIKLEKNSPLRIIY